MLVFFSLSIIVASVLAILLIAGAYVLSSGQGPQAVNAASTDELLKQYAAKDSDNDGLLDWEEALYGTNPQDAHSVSKTKTDGDAVAQGLVKPKFESAAASTTPTIDTSTLPGITPGENTLTTEFARTLFTQYLENRGPTQPTPDEISTFVQNQVSKFIATHHAPDVFAAKQVTVSGTGPSAMRTYASAVERAFAAHTIATSKSELDYFTEAENKNDLASLKKVKDIGVAYTAIANAYIKIPVPQEAAAAHLHVANALAHLGITISNMGALDTDPLRAMLGLGGYQTDGPAFLKALAEINQFFVNENVTIAPGSAGSSFIDVTQGAADALPQTP
jgi:hypothetical protein